MKRAQYVIEKHSLGGCFDKETFEGTRAECRARCRQIQKEEDCGTHIVFKKYLSD